MKKANLRNDIYHDNGIYQPPFFKMENPPMKEWLHHLWDSSISRKKFEKNILAAIENGFFINIMDDDETWDPKMLRECGLQYCVSKVDSCVACPDGEIARLDAYQVLSHGTIDRQSTFFTDKERFTSIVGEEIVTAMEKILYEE